MGSSISGISIVNINQIADRLITGDKLKNFNLEGQPFGNFKNATFDGATVGGIAEVDGWSYVIDTNPLTTSQVLYKIGEESPPINYAYLKTIGTDSYFAMMVISSTNNFSPLGAFSQRVGIQNNDLRMLRAIGFRARSSEYDKNLFDLEVVILDDALTEMDTLQVAYTDENPTDVYHIYDIGHLYDRNQFPLNEASMIGIKFKGLDVSGLSEIVHILDLKLYWKPVVESVEYFGT